MLRVNVINSLSKSSLFLKLPLRLAHECRASIGYHIYGALESSQVFQVLPGLMVHKLNIRGVDYKVFHRHLGLTSILNMKPTSYK